MINAKTNLPNYCIGYHILSAVAREVAEDINGDPKIFPKKYLEVLDLKSSDSFLSSELLIKAKILNLSLKEVHTVSLLRIEGKSTVNFKTIIEFLRNILRYKFGSTLPTWKNQLHTSGVC